MCLKNAQQLIFNKKLIWFNKKKGVATATQPRFAYVACLNRTAISTAATKAA